ncbi:MAG: hypothetical protein JW929_03350 [Anaerolineales bacterium]|nr:hypothetical protein [Anaerolineales bacterium]
MQNEPIRKLTPGKVRAYKQAPWREQTRLLAIGLASVFGLMAMLGLFVFTGAQAAEAGLRVQSLIRERDRWLRQLEAQAGELAEKQSEEWMRTRAAELGFVPATAEEIEYLVVEEAPAEEPVPAGPTSLLYTIDDVAVSPAFRETLLEWILRWLLSLGGT